MTEIEKKNKDNAIIIDASKYQYDLDENELDFEIDPGEMSTARISAVIHKISQGCYTYGTAQNDIDPRYVERETALRSQGIDFGAYTWVDATYSAKKAYEWNMKLIDKYKVTPSSFWLDIEQYWQNGSYKIVLPSKQISDHVQQLAALLKAALGIPIGIYTRNSYIKAYSQEMYQWISAYPLWLADWLWPSGVVELSSWDDLRSMYLPPDHTTPDIPKNCSVWTIWQFTGDRFRMPGVYNAAGKQSSIDINMFNGTPEQYKLWLQGQYQPSAPEIVVVDPETETDAVYRCVVASASVRGGPGVEYAAKRYLRKGDRVIVSQLDATGRWGLISNTEWCAIYYSGGKILEKVG